MCATMRIWYILLLASLILMGRADDDDEELDESSEEDDVLPPAAGTNCPRFCRTYTPTSWTVCGTNGKTYPSTCHLKRDACAYRVNHFGACIVRPPVTAWPRPRPTTRRMLPATRRPTTVRITQPPTTFRFTQPPTTARPATTNPATTTEEVTCPSTCDLVFEPVCTTVGTYQSECAFNSVRCRGIISQDEMILYMGYCIDATSGP